MKPKTLKALKKSIQKWVDIYEGTGVDCQVKNCALCQSIRDVFCIGCPVLEASGEPSCDNTPYGAWKLLKDGGECNERTA